MDRTHGRILLLNGTSSAGKTTLAHALRPLLEPSFHFFSSDQLADAGFRPPDPQERYRWRERFVSGFHRSVAAFSGAGLDLLVEHIVEQESWAQELAGLLQGRDVFWVGVHAPLAELCRREQLRGDRHTGEALEHLDTHTFCTYHIEVDTSAAPVEANAEAIARRWKARRTALP